MQDAQRFFTKASSQFATFTANSTQEATVTLKTTDPKTSNWTANDWNTHFHYLSLKMNSPLQVLLPQISPGSKLPRCHFLAWPVPFPLTFMTRPEPL